MTRLAFFLAAALAPNALACQPGEVSAYMDEYKLKQVTGYIPRNGGTNGRVGTSASGADASAYSYQAFISGKNNVVMAAVPQPSARTKYFRGIVRVPAIEKAAGRCVYFFVGDTYGEGSNKFGAFGKMDIVHEPPEKNSRLFNEIKGAKLYIVSGPQQVRGKRVIARIPAATSTARDPDDARALEEAIRIMGLSP